MKLAEALTLRKHLVSKVDQLKELKKVGDQGLFELRSERVRVNDDIDEVKLQIPRVDFKDLTEEYDRYSKALRLLDTAIQQTNWTAELEGFTMPKGIEV